MKAIMLAAGMGRRLYGNEHDQPPKCMLDFAGKTLMRRHVEILQGLGIDRLLLVLGYKKDDVLAEASSAAEGDFVEHVFNPRFKEGPILSLACAGDFMRGGDDILFMDADLLYHPSFVRRLIESPFENCFMFDSFIDHDVDPACLCIRDGLPVEFGKNIKGDFDFVGEWPGFLRLAPAIAAKTADVAQSMVDNGELKVAYEAAFRQVLVSEPPGTFGFEDISGEPWIEIDYPDDIRRAEKVILPRIDAMPDDEEESPRQAQAL